MQVEQMQERKKDNALKEYGINLKDRNKMHNDRITGFRGKNLSTEIPCLLWNVY